MDFFITSADSVVSWFYYPKSDGAPDHLRKVADAFVLNFEAIDSSRNKISSNKVLEVVRESLKVLGFQVESGSVKVVVPVLFGRNGRVDKSFRADGFDPISRTVIEVEAGRAVDNNQFLKDLFEACMMHDVDYLVIALRKLYRTRQDFSEVAKFLDTLYASRRLELPLKGIMLIGY